MRSEPFLPPFAPGDTVWCALSGGADSVAMTHLLQNALKDKDVTLRVCHFQHHLRGTESDADEAFCRELCRQWGLPLTVGSGEVAAYAAMHGESIEEAARHCRYAFFETLPGWVATAHTADDQVETVLLRLLRGTGLKGLSGIPPLRAPFFRPLLAWTREDVLAYLQQYELPHREDSSNTADDCVRNRLRHRVIPLLKAENPSLPDGVRRMAETLRADEDYLDGLAASLVRDDGTLEISALRQAPEPLRRRALRRFLAAIHAPKLSASHILAVEALVFSREPAAQVSLPGGWVAARQYDTLHLTRQPPASFAPVMLPCPGEVLIPELGLRVICRVGGDGLRLAADCVRNGITLRPRCAGDTIRLSGGSRSLKKLFIDRKLPAAQRDSVPVLAVGSRVLAVMGIGESTDALPQPGMPYFSVTFQKEVPL